MTGARPVPGTDLVVAIAQGSSIVGDVAGNVRAAVDLVEAAAARRAALVVFPELSLVGYDLAQLSDAGTWVTEGDARLDPLRRLATRAVVTVAVGAPVRRRDGRRWLATVVLRPDGTEHVHGKSHLHGAEHDVFDDAPADAELVEVASWQVALAVCFDAAVPAHAASAAARGAHAYVASSLYVEGEERRMDVHFAARAMDHRMYGVVANHTGPTSIGVAFGASGVWAPTGERLVEAGTGSEMVVATLGAAGLAKFHRTSDAS